MAQRNNVLAGLLVLAAIIAIVAAVIMLGGGLEYLGKRSYMVRFELDEGVSGLKEGAAVQVGGVDVGTVKDVELIRAADQIGGIMVTISIDRSIRLRQGAHPLLVLPLLGSQGIINFPEMGTGAPLASNDVLDGQIAAPTFLKQAGYADAQREQFQNILRRFSEIGDSSVAVLSDVREKWPAWSERVDSISRNVDATVARGPEIAEDLEARLEQLRELARTVQEVLDENRQDVRAGVERFASIAEKTDTFMDRLGGELADTAQAMLENGRDALTKAEHGVDRITTLFQEQRPNMRRTLANLRLASDQLRDTLAEVRRAPWRLIYRPNLRELNYELLYDAARSYAGAVSDLRATTESIESLVASGGDEQALREGTLDQLLEQLRHANENFRRAEEAFMEQLLQGPGG